MIKKIHPVPLFSKERIIRGIVMKGEGKGKKLGYPTVNLEAENLKIESGVYAGQVRIGVIGLNTTSPSPSSTEEGRQTYKAGIFVSRDRKALEAHLIGFKGDLYGKEVEVEIREKIRDVKDFGSEEELIKQIGEDLSKVKTENEKGKTTR